MSQTSTGPNARDRWDTPEIKLQNGKKGRLRKDRYSSLLIANMMSRQVKRPDNMPSFENIGANLRNVGKPTGDMYKGPEWFTSSVNSEDIYLGVYRN